MHKVGRLALRHEGSMWNAYYAMPDTMEGSFLLGSIVMAAVVDNRERKQAFMDIMIGFVADMIESRVGYRPDMNETDAPESERSGHG